MLRNLGLKKPEEARVKRAVFHSGLAADIAGKRATTNGFGRGGFIKSQGWQPVLVQRLHEEAAPAEPETFQVTPLLRSNYQRFGKALGATSAEDYQLMAQEFLKLASRTSSQGYTFLKMSADTFAVDFREGDMRAIYRKNGQPLAFFIPNHLEAGFSSREEEFRYWVTSGKLIPAVAA
ncbi:MAG: hypothetical protein J0L97_05295 [Alphaproteobacteria bacterium]|nr:hypothetical protein [Alphaproteobacteria bacterium]